MRSMHEEIDVPMYGGMYGYMHGMHGTRGMHGGMYHMGMMHRHWSGMHHGLKGMHGHMMSDPPQWMHDAMHNLDEGLKDVDKGMKNSGADKAEEPAKEDAKPVEKKLDDDWVETMNRGMGMMDEGMHMLQQHRDDVDDEEFYGAMMRMHDYMWGMHGRLGHGMYWCLDNGNGMHGMGMHGMHRMMGDEYYRAMPGHMYHTGMMHHGWSGMHHSWDAMHDHMGDSPPQWMRDALNKMHEGLNKFDKGAKKAGVDKPAK
jgi:hypothetical protein